MLERRVVDFSDDARVTVASVQLAPAIGDLEANRALVRDAVARAAAAGAQLVVVPELATSGYVFESAAEARSLALPAEDALAPWVAAADEHGIVLAGGFAERDGDVVYNSAAIVDGSGVLVVYRKVHLWDREQLVFTPGSAFPPVIDTPVGRLGLCVCYDLEFPEMVRGLALAGAELVCVPTNWPYEARPTGERPMEIVRAMAAASCSRVFIAAADRCGRERGVDWVGGSVIVGPDGWPLAGPPASASPALLVASCDLALARDKRVSARNDVLADRRPDVYAGAGLVALPQA
jgi:predicted amidohydrolase